MKFIDLHCDTIGRLMELPQEDLIKNSLCVNLEGMEKAETLVQFFACFVHGISYEQEKQQQRENWQQEISPSAWERAYEAVLTMAERIDREQTVKIRTACSYEDILKNQAEGKISMIKTLEEGGVLNGSVKRLDMLYDAGIRLVTLTWNFPNCLGFPNSQNRETMNRGLTPFGCEIVERMNELGMLVDVSHLSDKGFWDCIRYSKKPICASHSNARSLCGHPRNLTDEMLKALGESGGVAGLNFYPAFLREAGSVTVEDIAEHALHMIHTGGEEVAAVGTDFDGFDNEVREGWVSGTKDMELVWDAMRKKGITPRQLDKILCENALRVIRETIV